MTFMTKVSRGGHLITNLLIKGVLEHYILANVMFANMDSGVQSSIRH